MAKASIKHDSGTRGTISTLGGQKSCTCRNTNAICWRVGHQKGTLQFYLSDSHDRTLLRHKGINERAGGAEEPPAPQCQRHLSVRAINTASANPPWQQLRPNTIAAPGEQRAPRKGGQGATPAATPRPSVVARGPSTQPRPLLLSNSHNQMQSRRKENNERGGGGTRGCLRSNAANTFRLRADHQRCVEKFQ